MSKQDRHGVRTAADIERKYGFGKTFAEILGIAEDAHGTAEQAKSAVTELDKNLTQDEIFNRLTKNGTQTGIYRDEAGNYYINADYIRSGKIRADLIDGSTLDISDGARIANFYISDGFLYNGIGIGYENSCGIGCGSDLGGSDDWIFWAGNGAFRVTLGGELHTTNLIASGGSISGWKIDYNSITTGTLGQDGSMWLCSTGTETSANIGTGSGNGWCIGVGANFGVKKDGSLFASNANISGTINATDGEIGGWHISNYGLASGKHQHEGHVTETYDIIVVSSDSVEHVYYDGHDATSFHNRAEWDWIIGSAQAWAKANSLL